MKQLKNLNSKQKLHGSVSVPPDKSIAQRAIIFSGIAEGKSIIKNFPMAGDPQSTLGVMQQLGIEVQTVKSHNNILNLEVNGKGMQGLLESPEILDCGNSGTCLRLMMGLLAGNPHGNFAVLTGDASLRKRPMKRVSEPLRKLGADIYGRQNANLAPIALKGKALAGGLIETPVASAQLKSALLLAGLNGLAPLTVKEPEGSRNHTELMLKQFGADIQLIDSLTTEIRPSALKACALSIPGDISSAAFLLVAALIVPDSKVTITNVGLNPTRSGILKVLEMMGAKLEIKTPSNLSGEPIGDITLQYSQMKGVEIGGAIIPNIIDEIPILSLLASQATGQTVIKDAAELRVKESDRLKAMANVLKGLGVKVEELPDGMIIEGRAGEPFEPIVETFEAGHDHRIAMTVGIASLFCTKAIGLQGHEWANVSFPGFFNLLETLTVN